MSSGKSYDQPLVISYGYGVFDFAAAGLITAIPVPLGKTRFRVEEISVQASEVFTTGGKIELGTAADPNHYASLTIGTLADTVGLNVTNAELFDIGHGGKGIADVVQEDITQIEVVFTTSTTTGIGATTIVLGWW
jgi:hypothetical protein